MRQILIKTRFILLISLLGLLWVITGFMLYSNIMSLDRLNSYSVAIESLPGKVTEIKSSINSIIYSERRDISFYERGRSDGLASFNRIYLQVYNQLKELQSSDYFHNLSLLNQKFDNISSYLIDIQTELEQSVLLAREIGWEDYGLTGTISEHLEKMEPLATSLSDEDHLAFHELTSMTAYYLIHPSRELFNNISSSMALYFPGVFYSDGNSGNSASGLPLSFTASLRHLSGLLQEIEEMNQQLGYTPYDGHQGNLFRFAEIITEEANALSELFLLNSRESARRIQWKIGITIVLFLALLLSGLYTVFVSVMRPFERIKTYIEGLASGKILPVIEDQGDDEISAMADSLNTFSMSLKDKAIFASAIKQGEETAVLHPLGPDDHLANALMEMGEHLKQAKQEDRKHKEASEKRRWANEGVAHFGEILRSHSTQMEALADDVIKNLVKHLNASLGGMFLISQDDETQLNLVASFAFDKKKYIRSSFNTGEGLIGTCAIEKQKIFLTDIPEEYIKITSGLGESKPRSLLLVPLKLKEEVLGVIELASIRIFEEHEIDFTERIAESIASTITSVRMNIRTGQLLEQSQKQARDLAEQEEKMRESMQQLQATQDESARRESEITGILNAIQNSALVAEYDMEERLISINDKFLILLETQRDHIMGKRLHEIIGISRHTDTYKQLWQKLKEGETISNVEKIKLVNGKEIWLRQTYTPIPDKEGIPFKALNIATDITENIIQQESLAQQASEITRANIEMKSFSEAVDLALIKCVYSPTGQILETNENFEHATGYSAKELIGKNNRIFLQKPEKEHFEKIWEDISKDKPYSGVIRRTKPTGEQVWLMSTFTPVRDESGTIYKVYYLGQDITERKLKYQLLEDANNEIERLKQQLGES